MVELAIKNHDNFLAETIEIKLAKPNYTFNTIEILTKLHPIEVLNYNLCINLDASRVKYFPEYLLGGGLQ